MIPVRVLLNDGGHIDSFVPHGNVVFIESFGESIGLVQSLSASNRARNAVLQPAVLIARFLGLTCTPITSRNAATGVVDHAPLHMTVVVKKMEEAYAAHLIDYAACDCPVVYNLQFMSVLRDASYNWLGFIWQPGFGQNAHQIKIYMYSSA
jgi:hypothetical protein